MCFVNVTVGLSHLCTVALGGGGGGGGGGGRVEGGGGAPSSEEGAPSYDL